MVMSGYPFTPQQQPNLGEVNEATLMALAQQGNPQFTHAALLEQAAAQGNVDAYVMLGNTNSLDFLASK